MGTIVPTLGIVGSKLYETSRQLLLKEFPSAKSWLILVFEPLPLGAPRSTWQTCGTSSSTSCPCSYHVGKWQYTPSQSTVTLQKICSSSGHASRCHDSYAECLGQVTSARSLRVCRASCRSRFDSPTFIIVQAGRAPAV